MSTSRVLAVIAAAMLASPAHPETIGLRFVVSAALGATPVKKQQTTETLQRQVHELNGYFRNSEVNLIAQIVHVEFAAIDKIDVMAILEDMQGERGAFAAMFAKANEYGADYTVASVDNLTIRGNPGCGRAFAVNRSIAEISSTRRAFAAVNIVCGSHTLAHELGHLMGLNHGHLVNACQPGQGHASAITSYANGYAEGNCDGKPQAGEFGTIMVGGWMKSINGNGRSSLPMFSNPRVRDARCGARAICGDEKTGDEARVLNENARHYAGHEEPDVHTLQYESGALAECIRTRYRGIEIRDLVELRCPAMGIESMAGIEQLVALKRIDLSQNRIQKLDPIRPFAHRKEMLSIDLSGNPIADCKLAKQLFDNKILFSDPCL
jgi:hypothetical protein